VICRYVSGEASSGSTVCRACEEPAFTTLSATGLEPDCAGEFAALLGHVARLLEHNMTRGQIGDALSVCGRGHPLTETGVFSSLAFAVAGLALGAGALPLSAKTLCAEAMSATVAISSSSRISFAPRGPRRLCPDWGGTATHPSPLEARSGAFAFDFGSPGFADRNGERRDRRILLESDHRPGARHAGEVDRVWVGCAGSAGRHR
jgi:hypothetical protein